MNQPPAVFNPCFRCVWLLIESSAFLIEWGFSLHVSAVNGNFYIRVLTCSTINLLLTKSLKLFKSSSSSLLCLIFVVNIVIGSLNQYNSIETTIILIVVVVVNKDLVLNLSFYKLTQFYNKIEKVGIKMFNS